MLKAAEFFVGGQQLVRLNEKVIGEVSKDHGINATEMGILLIHLLLSFPERLFPFSSIITNILFHYLFRLCYFQDFFVLFERVLSYHWASSA